MRTLVAKLVSPIVWRIPGHGAKKLFKFSLAEHGSMLDVGAAARLTNSAARRVAYLRHSMDEARHAHMFALRSAELREKAGTPSLGWPHADTEDLFVRLGEVRFLAFVHRGESRGRRQFETYRDWFGKYGDRKTAAMFAAILEDEKVHESYTRALLVELAGGEAAARWQLRLAGAWEAWRMWRRAGKFVAGKCYFIAMLLASIVMLPFSVMVRLLNPERKGWIAIERSATRPSLKLR